MFPEEECSNLEKQWPGSCVESVVKELLGVFTFCPGGPVVKCLQMKIMTVVKAIIHFARNKNTLSRARFGARGQWSCRFWFIASATTERLWYPNEVWNTPATHVYFSPTSLSYGELGRKKTQRQHKTLLTDQREWQLCLVLSHCTDFSDIPVRIGASYHWKKVRAGVERCKKNFFPVGLRGVLLIWSCYIRKTNLLTMRVFFLAAGGDAHIPGIYSRPHEPDEADLNDAADAAAVHLRRDRVGRGGVGRRRGSSRRARHADHVLLPAEGHNQSHSYHKVNTTALSALRPSTRE